MSKLTDRLEKLTYFSNKHTELKDEHARLQTKAQALDKEWDNWVTTNLTLPNGQVHMADILKKAIETTYEPKS